MSEPRPVFSYGLQADYAAPEAPNTARSMGSAIAGSLKSLLATSEEDGDEKPDFEALTAEQQARLVPEPDWAEGVRALHDLLAQAPMQGGSSGATVILGPPGSGVSEILSQWASEQGAERFEPPELIPEPNGLDLSALDSDGQAALVIPALHRFYERSAPGLTAMRQVIEAIRQSKRKLVLGCDSWAWSYMSQAVQIDAILPVPVALAPLTGRSLQDWLVGICGSGEAHLSAYRITEDDSPAFVSPSKPEDRDEDGPHELFEWIASASRGIPEVSLAIWRSCLRSSAEQPEGDSRPERVGDAHDESMIWVDLAATRDLPMVTARGTRIDAFVMHTLLLHGGSSEATLHRLLPFDAAHVTRSLATLQKMKLVDRVDDLWSVAHLAYPNVRSFLAGESFLIDAF